MKTNIASVPAALVEISAVMRKARDGFAASSASASKPHEYPTFVEATYVAGGNVVTVSKLYPDKAKALTELGDHDFLLFFDASGEKLGEAVIGFIDGEYLLKEA